MALTTGTRLGSYEILSALGAGGMGEVYRARDTKLNRDVAIKVLLPAVANDPDRLARFSREAQVLASLNHPNIAQIFGLDRPEGREGQDASATTFLVMELVDGEELAQRIARGPLPLDEALPIAKQIAEALEAAHEQGIIHRDLKPANIKVRPDGTVKVLDFGLAKSMDPAGTSSANAMNSPTLSMHATQAGIILGTAAYMSPEQARGKAIDRRTDIWAFGVVLFEMLTGARAFSGDDVTDTIVSVVSKEPDWSALPAVPAGIRRLLRRCLEKDPKRRLDSAAAVRIEIDEALTAPVSGDGSPESLALQRARGTRGLPFGGPQGRQPSVVAAVALLTAGITGFVVWGLTRPAPQPPPTLTRFVIAPPPAQPLAISGFDRDIAISPDGTFLVYRAGVNGGAQLAIRRLDQLDGQALTSVSVVRNPFFSPDGHWIGFFDGNELKKVSITGGPEITLCKVTGGSRGASWGDDNAIVFATNAMTGLLRVPAGGGDPKALTTPDAAQHEEAHVFPSVLPGGRGVLFTITAGQGQAENAQVAVLDLKTGQRKTLIRGGSHAEYVETGHLVYGAAGTLRAVRFDLARLDIVGDPVPVVEQVTMGGAGAADFAVSRHGTLVYVPGGPGGATTQRQLVWVDRKAHEEPITAPPRAYAVPRLSPDGTRVALQILDQENDIWTWDLARQTLTRLTFDPGIDHQPVWTPDSRRILFASSRAGASNLFWHAADGTGNDQRLTTSANSQYPTSVTPDGTHVLGYEVFPKTGPDIVQFAWDGAASERGTGASAESVQRLSEPLVQTSFAERNAEISPDGRYLAYQSNESGRDEVYVRPYPKVNDGRWQVSTGGGTRPAWARNGREFFYVDATNTLTAVPVQTTGSTFSASNPAKVFDTKYATPVNQRTYDVSPDGQRFLMIKEGTTDGNAPPASLVVVEHWFEELKRLVPSRP